MCIYYVLFDNCHVNPHYILYADYIDKSIDSALLTQKGPSWAV